jgi:hypothetical protein
VGAAFSRDRDVETALGNSLLISEKACLSVVDTFRGFG